MSFMNTLISYETISESLESFRRMDKRKHTADTRLTYQEERLAPQLQADRREKEVLAFPIIGALFSNIQLLQRLIMCFVLNKFMEESTNVWLIDIY